MPFMIGPISAEHFLLARVLADAGTVRWSGSVSAGVGLTDVVGDAVGLTRWG